MDSNGPTTASSLGELETLSLYDSLLRGVAAGTASVRIDAEVGPHGKFVLQQELGSGAMGRVYRALDRYLLRDVAIKFILRPEGMNHDDFMALFWQEAHIIARLDQHDNIVRILDVDRSSYPPFIVMEYLDGQSLERLLRRGPVSLPTALHVMLAAARGLRQAHDKGVYHRDLKPGNIFLQKTGRVKLLDFGLARIRNHLFETSTAKASFVTAHAVPPLASAGTPAYMAPEQWRGEEADTATDLWAMGAILYRLLANAPPFDADSVAALSARVLSGEPPRPLARLRPGVPAEVCELVEQMLSIERSRRPRSVSDVIAVLEAALREISTASQYAPSVLTPQSTIRSSTIWSTGGMDNHFAQGSGLDRPPRYWHKMLLVLVSSSDSGVKIFPDHLSTWILYDAGINLDILHFPPSQPGEVAENAARLKAALDERFKRPCHLFFVTHGEGTDVVLHMLLAEARRLRPRDGEPIELDLRSPFYRARHVAILGPGTGVATAHRTSPAPVPLVADLITEVRHFLAAKLPAPTLHWVGADDDQPSLHPGSPSVTALASLLVRPEMMLARETIARTFELDCAAKITSLVGPSPGSRTEDVHPTVPGAEGGTQAEVFEELLAVAHARHQRPAVIVVAGDAGVGKSTVIRMMARHLSSELITSPDSSAPLPVLLPLYSTSLTPDHLAALYAEASEDKRGRVLHDVLLGWWCDWFNDTTYAGAVGIEWLKARLRSEPMVLILDGIDEFIANHPSLGISDFQQLLAFLGTEYRKNGWFTVVLGVRSTQPGLPILGSNRVREILRLTTTQAMRQFPATSSWLSAAGDTPIEKLLLTPLILAQLNTRRPPATLGPSTRGGVILLALTTIIEQSDLCDKLDETGQMIDAQRWIDALMAVAWCLFRRLRGEIATTTLKLDGGDLVRSWQSHLDGTGQEAQGERLLSGFRLLCDKRAYDALLHRTILYPTGRGEVRFIHREWQDFLAARYLAQAVVYRYVDELRHVGNTARIAQMAGEQLCQTGVCIDEALVLSLLQRAQDHGARLITANFSALLTNSRIPIDGPAIDVFLSAVHTMPAIARCITLIGLGYRALRGDDASAQDLRHRLVRVFRDYRSAAVAGDDRGVMRSIAWCYRKAYARRFGGPPVTDDWPGLDEDAERAVLAMMCSTNDGGPRVLVEHRSVQMALLEVQQVVADDPFRPISGVHYLYCLAVARRHGAGIAELGRELPTLLADGSPYAAAIENDQLVPELREVLAACRRLELAP
ncbi:MAG TPA: serine/threonine-protein kinase [Kofleriaceae bacterium]|nr:serine/threonine-protein kinase [Kofleriaceae bacterium]